MDYAKTISAARYECVVCHLKSVTISELHRHQTFRHTAEELSLASIGLQNSLNYSTIGIDGGAFARSWLCDPQKHSAFYTYSATLLGDDNNNDNFERCVPLDCVVEKKDFQVELDSELSDRPFESRPRKIPPWCPARQHAKRIRTLNNGVLDLSRPKKFGKKLVSIDRDQKPSESNTTSEIAASSASKKKLPKKMRQKHKVIAGQNKTVKFESRVVKGGKEEKSNDKVKVKCKKARQKYGRSEVHDQDDWEQMNGTKEEKDRAVKGDNRKTNCKLLTRTNRSRSEMIIPDSRNVCDEIPVGNGKGNAKKKGSSRRKKRSSYKDSEKSSKSARKIAFGSEDEEEEISWKKNDVISSIGKVCVDRACLDVHEGFRENMDTTGLEIHPQNLVPDVAAQEVCVDNTCTESYPYSNEETLRSSSENFGTVKSFPPYPGNMDERAILVLDPITCKLVWTSFQLLEDSISENVDESFQGIEDPDFILESDSLMHHNYVLTENTRSSRSSKSWLQEDNDTSIGNETHKHQSGTNEAILAYEKNDSVDSSGFSSTVSRPLLEKFQPEENTWRPPRPQELRSNHTILENEENFPEPNLLHDSKSPALNSRSFFKSSEKLNRPTQSMPEKLQGEANNTTMADDENLRQTIFPQRSKRNRTVTNRYVPY